MKPSDTLGPYRVVEKLGAGGMGEVYRARDTKLDRDVAVKILAEGFAGDADRLARFEREAKAVAALSHPNILSIFDYGTQAATAYAVTELLEGDTLRERLAGGALPVRKAVEYGAQIATGLAAAHDKGIVHRDLKPENVFVTTDGRVKILDFGLAKALAPTALSGGEAEGGRRSGGQANAAADVAPTMLPTDPGTVLGTVGYLAPEQARGQAADQRSDIFALGCVLYEMLAGRRAFTRDSAPETLAAIIREDPPPLATEARPLPAAVERVVLHCLEKRPEDRFQSARDLAFALQALSVSDTTSGARAVAATVAPARRWRTLRWGLAGLVVVVAAAATGALLHWVLAPGTPLMSRFTRKTFLREAIFSARFLPDGQTIVFSAARSGNAPALYEIRAGALEARPFGPQGTHLLSVSPTGELAVLTNVSYLGGKTFVGQLARMSLEGAPTPWKENVRDAAWSPKGTDIAIVYDEGGGDRLEYPIGTVRHRSTGYLSDLRISPDGSRVAFTEHRFRYDNRGWVKTVDMAGHVTTCTDEFWGLEGLGWSLDGASLVFGAAGSQAGGVAHAGDTIFQLLSVPVSAPNRVSRALAITTSAIRRPTADG